MRPDTCQNPYLSSWEACAASHVRLFPPVGHNLFGNGGGKLSARRGNGPQTSRLSPAGSDATPRSRQPNSSKAATGLRGYCKGGKQIWAHYRALEARPLDLPTVHTVLQQSPPKAGRAGQDSQTNLSRRGPSLSRATRQPSLQPKADPSDSRRLSLDCCARQST